MTIETITHDDLQRFRMQLFEDIKALIESGERNKAWLRSAEVRKLLGISHGTLQNLRIKGLLPYRKIEGLMFYKYEDIMKLLDGDTVQRHGKV